MQKSGLECKILSGILSIVYLLDLYKIHFIPLQKYGFMGSQAYPKKGIFYIIVF